MIEDMLKVMMGPIPELLDDETITDIITNPDGYIWIKRWGQSMIRTDDVIPETARQVVVKLMAKCSGKPAGRENPIVYAQIPWNGARFTGQMPPIVHAACFTIRSHHHQTSASLESYVDDHILTRVEADAISSAVLTEKNILVAGETGSGKTTLVGALLGLMEDEPTRILTIEDTEELKCSVANWTGLYTSREVTPRDLLQVTLRSFPKRIIFGEIRDGSVCYQTLQAWISGHKGGIATVHADSVEHTLTRIEELCRDAIQAVPYETIAAAVDMIIHLHAEQAGVKATGVAWVGDWRSGQYELTFVGG